MYTYGATGGMSYSAPSYKRIKSTTIFAPNGGVNPLDDKQTHVFNRIIGLQYIIFTNITTNTFWKISVSGGYNALNNGYIGSFDRAANYIFEGDAVNCSIIEETQGSSVTHIVTFQITDDNDGRIYNITLSPYAQVLPTIQLDPSSTALGNVTINLQVQYYKFLEL